MEWMDWRLDTPRGWDVICRERGMRNVKEWQSEEL